MNKQQLGALGERRAIIFLEQQGFEIVERNWRFGRAEIDIIAHDAGTLVFVEVKTRSSDRFGQPEGFVSANQETNLINAADQYCHERSYAGPIRFDIVAITKKRNTLNINHFKDAFWSVSD